MSDLPYLTRMHSLSLSLFPRKWAPLGIRFDPPRLFDVSVPPQLPRPTACLLAWPPLPPPRRFAAFNGENSRNLSRERVRVGHPPAFRARFSAVRIYPAGWVSPVTHSAESIRLGNVRRSDAPPRVRVVHPARHVHLTCPDPHARPAEPLPLPPPLRIDE